DVLTGDDDIWLQRVEVLQPVLWAMNVSLAAVWETLGITPTVVIGHSQGEVAAAVVAGALSLDDAARVIALRSAICAPLIARGGLASVAAGREQVEQWLQRWPGQLSVGAINSPSSTVVSGDNAALAEFTAL